MCPSVAQFCLMVLVNSEFLIDKNVKFNQWVNIGGIKYLFLSY